MERKDEFDYVFEACKDKIHPAAIADLLSVPEFIKELQEFDGEINNVVLFKIAEKVYLAAKSTRYDKEFKSSYVEKHGVDEWVEYRKRYGVLTNGYRKARLSLAK